MCGLSAIYSYGAKAPPVDQWELSKISDHMTVRGPDGEGQWISTNRKLGLAHKRLAIIATSDEEMDQLCELIEKEIINSSPKNLSYERNSIYLRFAQSSYNKGTTATSLGELIGVSPKTTFAIGDNHNDLSMLDKRIASMIACPANSVQSVKDKVQKQGGYLASQNAGAGVAEAIGHFFNE